MNKQSMDKNKAIEHREGDLSDNSERSKEVSDSAAGKQDPIFSDRTTEELKSIGIDPKLIDQMRERNKDIDNANTDLMSLKGKKNGSSQKAYKAFIKKTLLKAIGYTDEYSVNTASARIEGEFGREIDVPSIKRIGLLVDCSGSQGADKYIAFLEGIEEFANLVKKVGNKVEVNVVYWGSSRVTKKYKLDKTLRQKLLSDSPQLGGTYLNLAFEGAAELPKSEAYIVLTDGELNDTPSTITKNFIKKNSKRIYWIFNAQEIVKSIKVFCPDYKKNSVRIPVKGR